MRVKMNPCRSPSTVPLLPLLIESRLRSSGCYSGRQLLRDYAAREFNALLWVSLVAVTLLLLKRVVGLLRLWYEGSKIPGPPSPSFYGHCKLLVRENFADVLSGLHEKYGSIFKLWLGPTQLLVSVKDPDDVKELLFKAEDKLPLTCRAFRLAFGRSSLFTSLHDEGKKRRESLAEELNTRLMGRNSLVPGTVMDSIKDKISVDMGRGGVNCEKISQHIAISTLGALVFGETFLAWSEASLYEKLLMAISEDACLWASDNITPFWRREYWEYKSSCSKLRCLTREILRRCIRNKAQLCNNYQKPYANNQKGDGIEAAYGGLACSSAMMLDSSSPDETCSHLCPSEELSANIMGLMFHGYLNIAGLISNILRRLAKHLELQDQIYSEIMARKGSVEEKKQNVDDLVVLTSTIYESARLLPIWPLLQRCSLKDDVHLKSGVSIPAGAVLVVPLQLVQVDHSRWGKDATEFNPYRFLSIAQKETNPTKTTGEAEQNHLRKRSVILNDPNENAAFLPFGSGARACVGQKFVIHGLVSLLASLLEHYEIRSKPVSEIDPKPQDNNAVIQLFPSPELIFIKRTN